jgi:hypothetical protein
MPRLDPARTLALAARVAIAGVAILALTRPAPACPTASLRTQLAPLRAELDRLRATADVVHVLAAAIPACE